MSVRGRARHASLTLAALLAGNADAQVPRGPPRSVPTSLAPCGAGEAPLEIVLLMPPASRVEVAAAPLRDASCDWFRDDHWTVSFSQSTALPEPSPPRGLRLTLELASLERARLHVDAPHGRWVHDVLLESGLDDAGVEALAEAFHSTAEAASVELDPRHSSAVPSGSSSPARSNAQAAAAMPPPAPSAADLPPSSAAHDPARITGARGEGRHLPVHTALGYQAYVRGPEPFMHGPAVHVELDAVSLPVSGSAFFRASAFASGTRRASGFAVRSSGASFSLGAAASVPIGGITARAAASAGVDLVALDVRVIDRTLVRSLPDRRVPPRFFNGVEAGVRWHLGSFELAFDALARLLWNDTSYQVLDGQRALTLFQPWRLQPGAVLELGYIW